MKNNSKNFKDKDLQIIMKCNLKIVDYLDVTLNLNGGTYRPFHKTNEKTTYIHVKYDHLPQIIKKKSKIDQNPAYLQQRKYFKIRKITMSRIYGKLQRKIKLHRRKEQNKLKISEMQHTSV